MLFLQTQSTLLGNESLAFDVALGPKLCQLGMTGLAAFSQILTITSFYIDHSGFERNLRDLCKQSCCNMVVLVVTLFREKKNRKAFCSFPRFYLMRSFDA